MLEQSRERHHARIADKEVAELETRLIRRGWRPVRGPSGQIVYWAPPRDPRLTCWFASLEDFRRGRW